MIEVRGLTKRYGDVLAVDDLSFTADEGRVVGFLGPNGAGKTTTLRMLLGLVHPTRGTATVHSRTYGDLDDPVHTVGAVLDGGMLHPGRSGRNHLRAAARSNGIPLGRVDEVIEQVGLGSAARRRIKGYSLGMRQRLGIAAALLGDPRVVLFDEPINGLDLDGVRWIRQLLRRLADDGRTVLVSSHLMSEMQQTADRLIVVGRGRLIADATTEELLAGLGHRQVRVRTTQPDLLISRLQEAERPVRRVDDHELHVADTTAAELGDLAHGWGIPLHHLSDLEQSLEQAFLELTGDSVQFHGEPDDHGGDPDARRTTEGAAR